MKSTLFNILVLACLLASATAANAAPRRLLTPRRLRGGARGRRAFAVRGEKFWKKLFERRFTPIQATPMIFVKEWASLFRIGPALKILICFMIL